MGIRGVRTNKISQDMVEPPLIVGIEDIISDAKAKGFIRDNTTDIIAIVQNADIQVVYEEMSPAQSGYLKLINNKWVIGVNKNHHINRQRFTIAHEFAHYYLHRNATASFEDLTFFRNENTSAIEYAANDFAGKLLMPEEDVRNLISAGYTNLAKLAATFNVSIDAMRYRVINLGYKIQK